MSGNEHLTLHSGDDQVCIKNESLESPDYYRKHYQSQGPINSATDELNPEESSKQLRSAFVRGMEEAIRTGLDFNFVAHAAMSDLLGTWAAQAFFSSTGTSYTTPETFATAAREVFPRHTFTIALDMVAKRASDRLLSSIYGEASQFQVLMLMLHRQVGSEPGNRKVVPLHDQRAEDELDKLVGHKTT